MSDGSAPTSDADVQDMQRSVAVDTVELAVTSDEQKPSNGDVELASAKETNSDAELMTPTDECSDVDAKKDVDMSASDELAHAVDDAVQKEKREDGNNSSSSSDSSSSSGSSSSSSDSSDDSDVEDVTDQFREANGEEGSKETKVKESKNLENDGDRQQTKQTVVVLDDEDEPEAERTANNDQQTIEKSTEPEEEEEDGMAEQWFHHHDVEPEGIEVEAVVVSHIEEEDVFLLPPEAVSPRKLPDVSSVPASSSATKRRRPEDSSDGEEPNDSPGEVTTSSSEADVSDVEVSSFASKRRKPERPKPDDTVMDIPPEYNVFENIAPDDHEFPHLKGTYSFKGTHRATFAGHWGFTEADFVSDREGAVSKFEYSSGYIPYTRRNGSATRPPHSGKYTGYFNLRQFSGKIVKIREDQVEFKFMRLAREGDDDFDSDDSEDDDAQARSGYRVIGRGKNKFGRFLVHGYYNGATGRMSLRRRYLE